MVENSALRSRGVAQKKSKSAAVIARPLDGVPCRHAREEARVSLYGMGRFPVTLYKEQWLRILASAPEIEAFIRENDSKLKTKD